MKTIKSKNELPDWFKRKKYPENLSATNWYREIRIRVCLINLIGVVKSSHKELGLSLSKTVDRFLSGGANPNSPLFYLVQHNKPIQPLSVLETLYLCADMKDNETELINKKIQDLLKMWRVEQSRKDKVIFSLNYEIALRDFIEFLIENKTEGLDVLKVSHADNPFLSYGRPLNGVPVTIDTQFDDQTILESVKRWLKNQRRVDNEKAKRPFNKNDFNYWTSYKIREVCDLDIWARFSGVRIQDKVIASALWSDAIDKISPIDILRTTTRKKIKEIFTYEVAVRLYGQLLIQEGENFLE